MSYGLQTADVLWITTAVLGMGAWALWQVNRRGKGLLGVAQRSGENASRPSVREILQQAPRFVRDVRIFRLLAIVVFISSISFFLILFEFLSRSRAAYPSNLDFQSFYGNVQAVLQVVIVGLQLFVANRLSRGGELPACRWGCRWS